jgi:hypothetical protein
MTDLRKAAEQALKALHEPWVVGPEGVSDAICALREALLEFEPKPTIPREEVIRMTKEAGVYSGYESELFQRLAELVAAYERDICAKICEQMASRHNDIRAAALEVAAERIRARGET